jgi:hypothetical protein
MKILKIPLKIFFAGGNPKFRLIPHAFTWGNILSIFWLGKELCIEWKEVKKND